ncbi:MAG: site-specific integrase [Anaerolineales bacterium]|nr:site-specific integrase [Anaerolineales bacterium]
MSEQLPLFSAPPPGGSLEGTETAIPGAVGTTVGPGTRPSPKPAPALGPNASLTAAILAWREHLERGHSPVNTVKAFIGDLNLAAQFVGAFKSLNQITTRDLDNWLQWQRGSKKCSPKTYARRVTSVKSFFRWLAQTGVLVTDPAAPLIQQTVLSPLPEVLTEAELETVLAAGEALQQAEKPDPRPLVLFTLLIDTGIKKGEVLNLVPNHVDRSNAAEPVLWVRYPNPRHRYKERKLRLGPSWIPLYERYLAQYAPQARLFPWSPRRLEYLLEDLTRAAGLKKRITFDLCRWTCAVRDLRAGMDDTHLRQKLGLSKIQWREVGMKLRKLTQPAL